MSLNFCDSDFASDTVFACIFPRVALFDDVVGGASASAAVATPGTELCNFSYNCAYEPHSLDDGAGCDFWRE